MVVFISESVIGLLSYVYQDRLGPDLEATLTQSFISSYGLDHDRTLAADNIQLKVRTSCSFCNDMVVYLCFVSLADTTKKCPHMLRSDPRELR